MKKPTAVLRLVLSIGLALTILGFILTIMTPQASATGITDLLNVEGARQVITVDLPNGTGVEPYAMAYNAANGYVYVTDNNTNDVSVVNGTQVIARVVVGSGPLDVVYNPSNQRIYVVNENSDNVSVINGTVKEMDIAVGNRPVNLVYNPVNGYIYAMNSISDTVSVIDGAAVIGTIPIGDHPSVAVVNEIAGSSNYGQVYVTNLNSNNVTVIGGSSGMSIIGTLPVGLQPSDISMNNHNSYLYVVTSDDNSVSIFDTSTTPLPTWARTVIVNTHPTASAVDQVNDNVYVLNTWGDSLNVLRRTGRALPISYFHVGDHPRRVSVDPNTHYAYVANDYSDNISVLDGSQITVTHAATITVGDAPQAILVHPTNGYIYVGNRGGNSISILQGLNNVATIPPQHYPYSIQINPNNHYAYIPMRGGNTVRVYNSSTMVDEIPVGHSPRQVAFNTNTQKAYVANSDSNSVSVINSSDQVIATINVQTGPLFSTVDEVNNRIYVLNWYSDTVSLIDGATNIVVANVPVGINPRRAALDPSTNYLYVANAFGNTVSVLNGANVIATLAPGLEPRFVLFNPLNGYMYVSNRTDGTVSVFNNLIKLGDVVVGSQPEDMAVDSAGNVYVANYGSNSVSVIQGTSVVDTIPVGNAPEGLAVGARQVFIVNSANNTVSVIEGGRVASTYSVEQTPRSVAYDLSSDRVYVGNYNGASLSILMPEAPRSTFTGTPLTGSAPLDVQFTSVVTGAVTAYSWNFSDGGTSSLANPNHIYDRAGSFGVNLTVTGPGGSNSFHRDSYVVVSPPFGVPTGDFSADITSGQVPLTVTFTAVTSGTVDTWQWDFGDGGTASVGNVVTHTYTLPDFYQVSLVISNSYDNFMISKPNYIAALPETKFTFLPMIRR